MKKFHISGLYEAAVCIRRQGLGEKIRDVVSRRHLLHLELAAGDQVLGVAEYLRFNVLRSIAFDEASAHLRHAFCVVLKNDSRLGWRGESSLSHQKLV